MSKQTSSKNKGAFWKVLLCVALAFFVVAGILFGVLLHEIKTSKITSAGIYDGGIIVVDSIGEQLPVVEPSGNPDVLVVPMLTNEIANLSMIDPVLLASQSLGIEITPFAGSLVFSPTTSPGAFEYSSSRTQFWINGQTSTNYDSSGIIELEQTDEFVIRIKQSDTWGDNGEVIVNSCYLYYSKDGGTWYRAKSDLNNDEFDFASLGTGTFQICYYDEYKQDDDSLGVHEETKFRSAIFTFAYGVPVDSFIEIPDGPSVDGYTFVGWYLEEACINQFTASKLTANITLYAKYVINTYTVTFNSQSGSTVNDRIVDWNTTVNLESIIPTRTGYDFLGWYTEAACINEVTSVLVKSDMQLFAGWELKTIVITLMVNGEIYDTIEIPYGTNVVAAINNVESALLEVVSMSTAGMLYDSFTDTASIVSDSIFFMSTKSANDVAEGFDWEAAKPYVLWGGLGLIGVVGIIVLIVALIKSKTRAAAAVPAPAVRTKSVSKSKSGPAKSKPSPKKGK